MFLKYRLKLRFEFNCRLFLHHSRNRPWHKSSEEPYEIRQLPHIDLQSSDFFCIFHYCFFMTFHVMHQIDKVFLVHFRSSLNESSCFLSACSS